MRRPFRVCVIFLSALAFLGCSPGQGGGANSGAALDRERAAALVKMAYGYPLPDKAVMLKRYLIEYHTIKKWAGGQAVPGLCVGVDAKKWPEVAPIIEELASQGLVLVTREKVEGHNCVTTFTRVDLTDQGRAFLLGEDDSEYALKVSEVDVNQVTGIVQQQGSSFATAEYDLARNNETPFSAILAFELGSGLSPLNAQHATFVLYDDGWRVEK